MIEMICWCGKHYHARNADIDRGWGLSCSKAHAAIRRDHGRPAAVRVDGIKVKKVRKKDRGANRITPDNRQYVPIDNKLVDARKLDADTLKELRNVHYMDNIGHIFQSGYFGHGQE